MITYRVLISIEAVQDDPMSFEELDAYPQLLAEFNTEHEARAFVAETMLHEGYHHEVIKQARSACEALESFFEGCGQPPTKIALRKALEPFNEVSP